MLDVHPRDLSRDARRLRLDTLVRLRWLAIAGQAAAVVIVRFGLEYQLPFGLSFIAIAAAAWLNIALRIRFPASHRLDEDMAALLLAFDILQLSALLYLTGGLQNPFALLFLAPVLISATALGPGRTLALGLFAAVAAAILAFVHRPLPWIPGQSFDLPFVYVVGIWASIVVGTGFTGVYAWLVAEEGRQLAQALAATELVLAREQHLSQLDGLAAAAAHELGTPLATIALVVKELDRSLPADGAVREDLKLLREQVERCRSILAKLTSLGDDQTGFFGAMSLAHLIEEVVAPSRSLGIELPVDLVGDGPEPIGRRNPGLIFALANLVDNAVDFAVARVAVEGRWDDEEVRLTIRDDGPGFPADILLRAGEPYVTTRGAGKRGEPQSGTGLGLGLFIAKTLIERSGASLQLTNAPPSEGGAVVRVVWPREAFSPPDVTAFGADPDAEAKAPYIGDWAAS